MCGGGVWLPNLLLLWMHIYIYVYVYTHTHTHTSIYTLTQWNTSSAIKKNEIMPFAATWMDLDIIIQSKVRNKYRMTSLICGTKNMTQINTFMGKKQTHRRKTDLWLSRRKMSGGGDDWTFRISRCKLLYIAWVNNKVILHSTGNYIHYSGTNHSKKEYAKVCVYIYIYIHTYTYTYIYYIYIKLSHCCAEYINYTSKHF